LNMDLIELTRFIRTWMKDGTNNALAPDILDSTLRAFDEPLVGCAAGDDPLFGFLKKDIGPDFYFTPQEAFAMAHPGEKAGADELRVIAWILPQTRETRAAHRLCRDMPSEEWSRTRHYGEVVNVNLRKAVIDFLDAAGVKACAPVLLPEWSREISEKYGFASRWSERHAAYACGLGTFGLSDGLITKAGKAVRAGSVVARADFAVTPRSYENHNAWCLYFATGKCKACMKRCPAGAITEAGHDKVKCKTYIRTVTAPFVEENQLGFRVNSCGFCQTGVPCESRDPTLRLREKGAAGETARENPEDAAL